MSSQANFTSPAEVLRMKQEFVDAQEDMSEMTPEERDLQARYNAINRELDPKIELARKFGNQERVATFEKRKRELREQAKTDSQAAMARIAERREQAEQAHLQRLSDGAKQYAKEQGQRFNI